MRPLQALLVALLALGMLGCGPPHIAPFTPRERAYTPGKYAQTSAKPAVGSLFSEAGGGYLEDTRAVRVGDVVVVVISETADAQGTAATTLGKSSTAQVGVSGLFGLTTALQKAHPNIDPNNLLNYASQSAFTGTGNTARNGQLTANIAVRVSRELPNGDLFLEGTKVVLINYEEYHLYISGVVRPADIAQDNTITSSRIADAQFEFTGRGDLADQNRKGWLGRALDVVNPL